MHTEHKKILLSNTLLIFKNIEKEKKAAHVVKKEKRDLPEMFCDRILLVFRI